MKERDFWFLLFGIVLILSNVFSCHIGRFDSRADVYEEVCRNYLSNEECQSTNTTGKMKLKAEFTSD